MTDSVVLENGNTPPLGKAREMGSEYEFVPGDTEPEIAASDESSPRNSSAISVPTEDRIIVLSLWHSTMQGNDWEDEVTLAG